MKIIQTVILLSGLAVSAFVSTNVVASEEAWTSCLLQHVVDDSARGTASIHACDLDNDGDVDLLGAVLEENAMVYWRNDGGDPIAWTRCDIDREFDSPISVYAADLDGDGDDDVVGAAARGDEIAVWLNGGGDPLVWKKQILSDTFDFAHEVYACDIDLDGDVDVLAASTSLNTIAWWRNDAGDPIAWTEQVVDSSFVQAKSVRVADFDGDGLLDIVGAALRGNEVAWWRNEGGHPIRWSKQTIAGDFEGAHRVQAVDMDGDGDADVLAAAYGDPHKSLEEAADRGSMVAWWRNDGGDPLVWERQTIGRDVNRACIAYAADVDGDGDKDVFGTAQEGNEVIVWRNDGGSPFVWTRLAIDDHFPRVWPLCVADLDGDGDVDVVVGSGWKGVNLVKWWENRCKE